MLLVHDHEPEPIRRLEDGGAGPDDDADLAGRDPAPLVRALPLPQRAVDERDVFIEVVAQPVEERHREGDLRHEDEHAAADRPGMRDGGGVDGRLAAGG